MSAAVVLVINIFMSASSFLIWVCFILLLVDIGLAKYC